MKDFQRLLLVLLACAEAMHVFLEGSELFQKGLVINMLLLFWVAAVGVKWVHACLTRGAGLE